MFRFLPIVLLLLPISSPADYLGNTIDIRFDSYSYSEPTSIDSFTHKFNGELGNGKGAVSFNQFSIGVNYKKFSLGLIKRLDYFYQFSPDTAKFYYKLENDIPFLPHKDYRLRLDMNHLEASGLKVGYHWKLPSNVNLYLFGSYLAASDFYQLSLAGDASWLADERFFIDAPAEIFSAHNELLTYPKNDAKGKGAALDIAFDWQINPHWKIALAAQDLYSDIDWKGALFSQINRWQIYQKDSTGGLDTRPLVEGRTLGYEQNLPVRWFAEANFLSNSNIHYFSKISHTQYSSDFQLGYSVQVNQQHSLSLAWHFMSKSFEVGYATNYAYIRLMLNSLNYKNTKSLGLNIGLSKPLF